MTNRINSDNVGGDREFSGTDHRNSAVAHAIDLAQQLKAALQ